MNTNAAALILAAGRGERFQSELPKVAHPILGTPMIHYVLRSLRAAGIERILAVVGYKKEIVTALLEGVETVDQPEPRGTGHAVLCARDALKSHTGTLLVVNGDLPLLSPDSFRMLARGREDLNADAVLLTACINDPTGYGRIVRDDRGRFRKIVEEADAKLEKTIQEVNVGAYAFRCPEIFEVLAAVRPNNAKNEYYLTDAISLLLESGRRVEAARVSDPTEAMQVNSRVDLLAVMNLLRLRITDSFLQAGVAILDPSTTYIEDDVRIGPDTTIEPFSVIRKGVRIGRGCRVGPFSHLRGGTVLEDGAEIGNFVEVKNSRIGPGSRAKHLSYLGDATLGARVNIGAGTITANYDGRRKNATIIEDDVFTGCNTVVVAPVRLGKGCKTGAGAVVPKGAVEPGATVVGVPARPLVPKEKK